MGRNGSGTASLTPWLRGLRLPGLLTQLQGLRPSGGVAASPPQAVWPSSECLCPPSVCLCVCVCRGHLCLCPCLCDDGVRRRGRPRLGFEPGGLKDRRGQGPAGAGPGPRHTPPPPRSPQPPASGPMWGGVPSGEPSGGDEPDRPGTGARPGSRDRLGSGVRDASWPPPPGPGRRPPPPRARRGRRSVHQSGRQASMQAGRQAGVQAGRTGRAEEG